MEVHVIVASRHGATAEIADRIAEILRGRSFDVSLVELEPGPTPELRIDPQDAVILGSAIYAGSWIKAARHFLDRYANELQAHRTWLFSSGPLGTDAGQPMDATRIATLELDTGAVDHHFFGGKLDREKLGVGERIVATALHAPEGDFRDWEDVASWADQIADSLLTPV